MSDLASHPELARKVPKCKGFPAPGTAPPPALVCAVLTKSLKKMHKYAPKPNNSTKANSKHTATRRSGTWRQNKSDSRSCDKSEMSSHLAAVQAV